LIISQTKSFGPTCIKSFMLISDRRIRPESLPVKLGHTL
jgi:hypothetical protein